MNKHAYSRPAPDTVTGRVWEIADSLSASSGRLAKRSEVIERFTQEGGNPNTASTQYHHWKQNRLAGAGAGEPVAVQLRESGRLVLPAAIREKLDLHEGDMLGVEITDNEIRLVPLDAAVRRAQALVRRYVPDDTSLVDELIAERRREARKELDE